jgi:hypothetical protein
VDNFLVLAGLGVVLFLLYRNSGVEGLIRLFASGAIAFGVYWAIGVDSFLLFMGIWTVAYIMCLMLVPIILHTIFNATRK